MQVAGGPGGLVRVQGEDVAWRLAAAVGDY